MTIIIVGVVLLLMGMWGMVNYWWSFLEIMRGLFPFLTIISGLIAIGAGARSASRKNGTEELED